jgi:hypothetical protein
MTDYIFSITPKTFEILSGMLEKKEELREGRRGNPDREDRLNLMEEEDELTFKITKILIESGEKHEELMVVDEEFDEGSMVLLS